ncbi:MAG: TerB family tellurite resistance protein [Ideonella sp.]|nr:TerB family tellurite resistance protein [Ideonella sp.]
MRTHPRNSPEAAARILALVLISDGHVCRSEFDVLERVGASGELGLDRDGLSRVVHTLCEDLLLGAYDSGSAMTRVDPDTLAACMAEVDDPALQRTVMRLAVAVAEADRHLADGETLVLDAASRHWGLDAPVAVAAG